MKHLKAFALSGCLIGLTFFLQGLAFAEPTAPDGPTIAPGWLGAYAITNNSTFANGAEEPDIAIAPNGSKMAIAYVNVGVSGSDNNVNPYYSQSTSANWDAWSASTPIHVSNPAARSFQLDITYDSGGTAHATWRDQLLPLANTQLIYKKGSFWGSNSSNQKVITSTNQLSSFTGASSPRIAATNSSVLDIVWSEDVLPNNPNIYHARSINGGTSWSAPKTVNTTNGSSLVPSLAADQQGILHATWEEVVPAPPPIFIRSVVFYSQGTPGSGTSVSWSTPITISKGTTSDTSRYPRIVVDGTTLYVSYTFWQNRMKTREEAHLVRCLAQCAASPNRWSLGAASSQFVDFNLSPNDSVLTSVGYGNGCAYIYYDGIPSGGTQSNEVIWGLSSCDAAPDVVTSTNVQSTSPSQAIYGGWIHLAYEQKGSGNRHVYYVRGKLPFYVYLPTIIKGS